MNLPPKSLDDLLRQAQIPGRDPSHWNSFPAQVTRELRRREQQGTIPRPQSHPWRPSILLWAGALAACVALAFTLGFWKGRDSGAEEARVASAKKYFKEIEALFPNQVRAIALEKSGPRLILSDTADVPDSVPLYVKICRGNTCSSFVTFSGQQIEVGGETYEVLIDGRGHVILFGKGTLWSSKDVPRKNPRERIEARALDMKT